MALRKFSLIKTVQAGQYTPTLTNVANVSASTAYECNYLRVGSVVFVSGVVDIDPTAAATSVLDISLPIPSNLDAPGDLAGTAVSANSPQDVGAIYANAVNDRATLSSVSADTANHPMYFTFSYQVIP